MMSVQDFSFAANVKICRQESAATSDASMKEINQ